MSDPTRHADCDSPTSLENPGAISWYAQGLRFSCTRCGACCTGEPGHVWVDGEEIARLATFLGMSVEEFGRRHLRALASGYSLKERPNGDCEFWDRQRGCTVYAARPDQCRTWPFWPEHVRTAQDWAEVTEVCPGAGRPDGRWYSREWIDAATLLTASRWSGQGAPADNLVARAELPASTHEVCGPDAVVNPKDPTP